MVQEMPPGGASLEVSQLANTPIGYEHLLSIQQHHHSLVMQQKDAEMRHLRARLESMEAPPGPGVDPRMVAALQTKDDEVAIMMAAKHKELELMAGLLQLREQQIDEFRQLCEAQQLEIQKLKRQTSVSAVPSESGLPVGHPLQLTGHLLPAPVTSKDSIHSPGAMSPPQPAPQPGSPSGQMDRSENSQHQQEEVQRLRQRIDDLEAALGQQTANRVMELEAKVEQALMQSGKALEQSEHEMRLEAQSAQQQGVTLPPPQGLAEVHSGHHHHHSEPAEYAAREDGHHQPHNNHIHATMPPPHSVQARSSELHHHPSAPPHCAHSSGGAGSLVHIGATPPPGSSHHHSSHHHAAPSVNQHHHTRPDNHHSHQSQPMETVMPTSYHEGSHHQPQPQHHSHHHQPDQHAETHSDTSSQHAQQHHHHHQSHHPQTTIREAQFGAPAEYFAPAPTEYPQRPSSGREVAVEVCGPLPQQPGNHHHHHHHHHQSSPRQAQPPQFAGNSKGCLPAPMPHEPHRGESHHSHHHSHHHSSDAERGLAQEAHHSHRDVNRASVPDLDLQRAPSFDLDTSFPSLPSAVSQPPQSYRSAVRVDMDGADLAEMRQRESEEIHHQLRKLREKMNMRSALTSSSRHALGSTERSHPSSYERQRQRDPRPSTSSIAESSYLEDEVHAGTAAGSGLDTPLYSGIEPHPSPGRRRGMGDRASSTGSLLGSCGSAVSLLDRPHVIRETLPRRSGEAPVGAREEKWRDRRQVIRTWAEEEPRGGARTPPSASGASSPAYSQASEALDKRTYDGWAYRPHPSGDPIDAAIATLVNRPGRYRCWRALLCRLDEGLYLCGTRKLHLRVDHAEGRIEASDDGGQTWADLEDVMRRVEGP